MKKIIKNIAVAALLTSTTAFAQDKVNVVSTAVPYLLISPDARGASMGDQGVATLPDANSMYWNVAKSAFLKKKMGASVSYSPWLSQLVNDVFISNIDFFYKPDNRSTLNFSFKYFSLGEVNFRQHQDDAPTQFYPAELALDVGYGLQLSRRFSAGVVLRYLRSDLASGANSSLDGTIYVPANSLSADIGFFYKSKKIDLAGKDGVVTAGLNISNLGGKIKYTDDDAQSEFMPALMRLGAGLHMDIDKFNRFSISGEMTKLLVPTPQFDTKKNEEIRQLSVVDGIFRSFNDSPEGENEFQEINFSIGMEYWYNNQFAFRAGYFYEDPIKGNRQYMSAGLGIKLQKASLDMAYLFTLTNNQHPLKSTLRFSLGIDIDAFMSNAPSEEEQNSRKGSSLKEKNQKKDNKKKDDKKDKKDKK
ncbi:MAG: type IX secretion system outer membrane channel protein PorV [Flavobacteriales bacterium]|jgi:hypothetical protein|nr:type IX secretion system outer membrane channel protein PorV [Flavobacteriales bacterium]